MLKGKVLENDEKLSCWNCGSQLEFDLKSATPLIASLPKMEREEMGRALIRAAADRDMQRYPHFAEALEEEDLDKLKRPYLDALRDFANGKSGYCRAADNVFAKVFKLASMLKGFF